MQWLKHKVMKGSLELELEERRGEERRGEEGRGEEGKEEEEEEEEEGWSLRGLETGQKHTHTHMSSMWYRTRTP